MINSEYNKNFYRERFRKNRLNIENKTHKDSEIAKNLLSIDEVKSADRVLIYISSEREIDTFSIIKKLREMGKQIAAPVCIDRDMSFYLFDSGSELKKGSFGIYEPKTDGKRQFTDYKGSVCIVPMLGFDKKGFRIGYGGGFYDRFLKDYDGKTVGLCYSINGVEKLPNESHDRPLEIIVTEDNIFKF